MARIKNTKLKNPRRLRKTNTAIAAPLAAPRATKMQSLYASRRRQTFIVYIVAREGSRSSNFSFPGSDFTSRVVNVRSNPRAPRARRSPRV